LGLALATSAMAEGRGQSGDPLSKMSPALQLRAQHSLRKVSPPLQPAGIAGPPANDACTSPATAFDGPNAFSTLGATTDGPAEPGCLFCCGDDQINQDVWFTYVATATDLLNVSLCAGTAYDSKIAVYDGAGCPAGAPLACNDDSCGLISAVEGISVIAGNSYTIRIGGFTTNSGTGSFDITFGTPPGPCGAAGHDCCTQGPPGCDDAACCELICGLDPFCCDTFWDGICVNSAEVNCVPAVPGEPYCPPACDPANPNDCFVGGPGPGCNNVECCETVCCVDPFCCDVAWDGICASEAQQLCGKPCPAECPPGGVLEGEDCGSDTNGGCNSLSACEGTSGNCCFASFGLGCEDPACSASVCAIDPFCCDTSWDGICASEACADPNCDCEPAGGDPFVEIECGDTVCGNHWADGNFRDTDWYRFSVTECGTVVTWSVNSEFPAAVFILNNVCPPALLAIGAGTCPNVATAELFAGTYVAFVAPAAFNCLPCGGDLNDYTATLTCDGPCPGDIAGANDGGPDGTVDVDDLLKVINNWGDCKK
jgi:hypothetical protein